MTSPYLIADLKRDEGCKLEAYQDTVGIWTVGYGHAHVEPGTCWTQAEAEDALAKDVATVSRGLDAELPWWRDLDDYRQDALANMAFNLGVAGLLKFSTFLGLMRRGLWALAAHDLGQTAWAWEVRDRAARIAAQIRTGQHAK